MTLISPLVFYEQTAPLRKPLELTISLLFVAVVVIWGHRIVKSISLKGRRQKFATSTPAILFNLELDTLQCAYALLLWFDNIILIALVSLMTKVRYLQFGFGQGHSGISNQRLALPDCARFRTAPRSSRHLLSFEALSNPRRGFTANCVASMVEPKLDAISSFSHCLLHLWRLHYDKALQPMSSTAVSKNQQVYLTCQMKRRLNGLVMHFISHAINAKDSTSVKA
ncbi:hypothetical protein Acr_16g0006290 [Actinidia rufa]|uniref:Uncharacterized protein n=1 Tax=Actinidia rufa TaxID=165716 RepID=A0A7J0FZ76_9ERIC|nr:hypothetical protein Acr_16g0006290 [Actinidia rufa]